MIERQQSFADLESTGQRRRDRREEFLERMDAIVPWAEWVALIGPHYPDGRRGRRPVGCERMLRMYLLQVWFRLSDEGCEDAVLDSRAMQRFVGVDMMSEQVPDATTLLKFRHLLEREGLGERMLAELARILEDRSVMMRGGSIVDATFVESPSSTKNRERSRDPEAHQAKKGKNRRFGYKAHAGVDLGTGLVHTVEVTAANVSDISQAHCLLRPGDRVCYAGVGYTGVERRPEVAGEPELLRTEWCAVPLAVYNSLVVERILDPGSKLSAWGNRGSYFFRSDFSEDDLYLALDSLEAARDRVVSAVNRGVERLYGRDTRNVFYDVTNYYFECDPDDLRRRGVSKEHRPDPIVQMGLLQDADGVPITYRLFPGNTADGATMPPVLADMKRDLGLPTMTAVADKGLNTSANMAALVASGDGFVFSQSIRGTRSGRGLRARELVADPGAYSRATHFGAARYAHGMDVDRATGEVVETARARSLDLEAIEEDARADGYHLIVTSRTGWSDEEVIGACRGLWRIEESFRVTKSDIEARPVYVRTPAHIEAHFLTCYVALTILRLLQRACPSRPSAAAICAELKGLSCSALEDGWWVFDRRSALTEELFGAVGIGHPTKYMRTAGIRRLMQKRPRSTT